ncbi:SOS response-associated peptidase [Desulfovibrio inopinatus]|uniref:SOS response-associated peptidase n=1 Tax=Desulfovibrio inopinatus TaxID=102109 RepID=UPI00040EB7AE|nr:SOS response-associated peptidase [Desulfovibrio inopinatus]
MCGRFALGVPRKKIAEEYGLDRVPRAPLRYNIAPSQSIEALVVGREQRIRHMALFRWGLVPFWAKDIRIGSRLINARSETVLEKPAFKAAIKYRRCLIPAQGFYEWKKSTNGKTPHFIFDPAHDVISLAGIYEHYEDHKGTIIDSACILTRPAVGRMASLHDRMPVIVTRDDYAEWLDPSQQAPSDIRHLLERIMPPTLDMYPVSSMVNNPSCDIPECLQRLQEN